VRDTPVATNRPELDAATTITGASSYQNNYAVQSVLSRLNYDFADKASK